MCRDRNKVQTEGIFLVFSHTSRTFHVDRWKKFRLHEMEKLGIRPEFSHHPPF